MQCSRPNASACPLPQVTAAPLVPVSASQSAEADDTKLRSAVRTLMMRSVNNVRFS